MDLNKIHNEIVEVVAKYIDVKDQVSERVPLHLIDHKRWREKYMGLLDSPTPIYLNTFRCEVDTVVASLMLVIEVAE